MAVFPPCLMLFGLFLLSVGVNGIRTKSFMDSIQEGTPSVVLGAFCVTLALVLFGVAGWMTWNINQHGNMGGM